MELAAQSLPFAAAMRLMKHFHGRSLGHLGTWLAVADCVRGFTPQAEESGLGQLGDAVVTIAAGTDWQGMRENLKPCAATLKQPLLAVLACVGLVRASDWLEVGSARELQFQRMKRALAARPNVPDFERLWLALSLEEQAYVGLLLQELRGESVLYGPRRVAQELFAVTRVTQLKEDKRMNPKETPQEQDFWPSQAHRNENSRLSGSKLITWLRDKALAKGDTSEALAAQLDLTVDELADYVIGKRAVTSAPDEFISRCAVYLCVPRIAVMIAAEQVVIGDFMFPADYSNDAAEVAIHAVAGDPLLGSLMPESVHRLPVDVKRFIALLFQEATGHEVFSRYQHLPMVLQDAQLAALAVDEMQAKANAFN